MNRPRRNQSHHRPQLDPSLILLSKLSSCVGGIVCKNEEYEIAFNHIIGTRFNTVIQGIIDLVYHYLWLLK
jgi:hypothetical protein